MGKFQLPTTDVLKNMVVAFVVSFLGSFGVTAAHWLQGLAKWASTKGAAPLPGLSVVGYAAVSALIGAGGAAASFLIHWAQLNWSWVPGSVPTFAPAAGVAAEDPLIVELRQRRDQWLAVERLLAETRPAATTVTGGVWAGAVGPGSPNTT